MISVSTKMAYQKVREISRRSGKSQGTWKSKKWPPSGIVYRKGTDSGTGLHAFVTQWTIPLKEAASLLRSFLP